MEDGKNGDQRPKTPENPSERAAAIVSNMALAHELVMNDEFKLQDFPDNSLEKHVKEIVHKAFWEKLTEDLEATPPDYKHVLVLISELKENLLSLLLPHHNSLRAQVNEVLDVELIKQQIDHNALDLRQCAQFVVNLLGKLCAPARDAQVQALLHVDGIVNLFREIFKVIDIMKIDMANFQLQAIRPQLLQQSIEYERKKFAQYLEANPAGLLSTKVWLEKGKEVADEKAVKPSSPSPSPTPSDPTPSPTPSPSSAESSTTPHDTTDSLPASKPVPRIDLLVHSYLGIIFGEPGWPYPETLIMDELRLAEMRSSIHRSTLLASIMLVTMQTVARQLKSDTAYTNSLKRALFILLDGVSEGDVSSSMSSIYEQVKEETNTFLVERGFPKITGEHEVLIKGQIIALGDPEHQLRKLLSKRAYDYMFKIIKARLRHGNGRETVHVAIPPGLDPVGTELSELALRYGRLASLNASTYGPFYDKLLDEPPAQSSSEKS